MSQPEQCELCSATAVPLHERCDANVCRSCLTLLWFAEVLLESDATEAEIVPTLAFARHADALWTIRNPQQREAAAHQLVERYAALEFVDVVSGVPMLRMKPAFVEVVRYEGSNLAKRIRIRVLSRFAEPRAMAELYWDVCEREGLPRHKTSPGSLWWDFDRMHMVVDVGPREDIHPARLHQHTEYPQVRRFAFPLDTVVQRLLRALLGQGQDKNLMFAALLSDLGRSSSMSLEKAVIACVLWDVRGERSERGSTNIQRSVLDRGRRYEDRRLVSTVRTLPRKVEPQRLSQSDHNGSPEWQNRVLQDSQDGEARGRHRAQGGGEGGAPQPGRPAHRLRPGGRAGTLRGPARRTARSDR
jgi:hypothetical protein